MSEQVATSKLVSVASGVASSLSAYSASVSFAPDFDGRSIKNQSVIVVPVGTTRKYVARGRYETVVTIEIGLVKKASDAEMDTLICTMESIGNSILDMTSSGMRCISVDWDPIYSYEKFRSSGVFIGVIKASFMSFA